MGIQTACTHSSTQKVNGFSHQPKHYTNLAKIDDTEFKYADSFTLRFKPLRRIIKLVNLIVDNNAGFGVPIDEYIPIYTVSVCLIFKIC